MDLDRMSPINHLPRIDTRGTDNGRGRDDPPLETRHSPAAVLVGGRQAAREIAIGARLKVVTKENIGLVADGFLIVRDRPGDREPEQYHSAYHEDSANSRLHHASSLIHGKARWCR